MSDTRIIYRFLTNEFPNDHPVVYLYVCGQERSQTAATNKGLALLKDVFSPPYSLVYLKELLIEYLDIKKEEYKKGVIQVKPLY
jgi:hypothetical protein